MTHASPRFSSQHALPETLHGRIMSKVNKIEQQQRQARQRLVWWYGSVFLIGMVLIFVGVMARFTPSYVSRVFVLFGCIIVSISLSNMMRMYMFYSKRKRAVSTPITLTVATKYQKSLKPKKTDETFSD